MSVSLKIPLRHPVKDRPLIDYELFSYILSPILGGTTIGVILHLIFPNWITILCLCLLSGYVCFSMFKKGLNLHRIETNSRQVFKETENGFKIIKETNEVDDNSARDVILSNLFEIQEKKIMPLGGVLQILGIFVIVVLGAFIKGGKGIDSILGLEECSTSFWVFISTYLVSYMLITFYTGRQMIVKTQQKTQVNYDFDDADVRWNKDNTLKIGLIAVMTGVAAGALGIGGGIIMNPVLLSIGLRPEVCTATSSFVIVFATSVSVIQFIVSGIINF